MITKKYRKKPIVIEAYQTDKVMYIETLEGTMKANVGDYIITGVNGEQYPCKPDIFNKTYETVSEEETREYLVRVRYALSGLKIYRVKTDNIYRIIGKFYCTSFERIKRIDYSRYNRGSKRYWENEGFEINQYTEPVLSEDYEPEVEE